MVVHNRDNPTSPRTINITWLLPVKNNLTAPPANPNTGDRYRVLPSATGAWLGWDNSIAIFNGDTNKWEFDLLTESQVWYDFTAQNWHYMSNAGVITQFDKIPLAESDVTGLVADLASKAPIIHKSNHVSGGSDAFLSSDILDCLARVKVLLGGTLTASRRGINLIAGSNITISESDDSTNEKVDVTINAITGGSHPLLDGAIDSDTISQAPVRGMLVLGNATPKWSGLSLGAVGYYLRSNGTDLLYSLLQSSDIVTSLGFTPVNPNLIGAPSGLATLNASSLLAQSLSSLSLIPSGTGYLKGTGGAPAYTDLATDTWKEIGRQTLAAAATSLSVSFTSYTNLKIMIKIVQPNGLPTGGNGVYLQLNGDTGSTNYGTRFVRNGAVGFESASNGIVCYVDLASIDDWLIQAIISNISGQTKLIVGEIAQTTSSTPASTPSLGTFAGSWVTKTGQISSIQLFYDATNKMGIGTEIIVYGRN